MTRTLARAHLAAFDAQTAVATAVTRRVSRRARGATLLEYAILAGIAVVLGSLMLTALRDPIAGIFDKVKTLLGQTTTP